MVFDKNSQELLGINTFGIRLRHEVCEKWITAKKTMDFVLENLEEANFDPEFYKHYEGEILAKWKHQTLNLEL